MYGYPDAFSFNFIQVYEQLAYALICISVAILTCNWIAYGEDIFGSLFLLSQVLVVQLAQQPARSNHKNDGNGVGSLIVCFGS